MATIEMTTKNNNRNKVQKHQNGKSTATRFRKKQLQQQQEEEEEEENSNRRRNNNNNNNNGGFHYDDSIIYNIEEEEEELEVASLLGSSNGGGSSNNNNGDDDDDSIIEEGYRSNRFLIRLMFGVLIMASLALFLPGIFSKSDKLEVLRKPARIPVQYDCPIGEQLDKAKNYDPSFITNYVNISKQITNNMTEFLETFKQFDKFDDWGRPYDVIKQGMFHWKSTKYPNYLKDGDSIYESACGIGLNLYMTLEILSEVKGIENLFVYGNEYVDVSAKKAEAVFDNIPPANGRKGVICPGDSANLYFVPDNSFDLVFTGYISPILDPLHFEFSDVNKAYDRLNILCNAEKESNRIKRNNNNNNNKATTTSSSSSDEQEEEEQQQQQEETVDIWEGTLLSEIAQQRQNDWYGVWIKEMIRIAKPGVPVIVEQVSLPYCQAHYDWGGVSKEWFLDAVHNNAYDWNVQPDSIEFEKDAIFRNRYHVFMLKEEEI